MKYCLVIEASLAHNQTVEDRTSLLLAFYIMKFHNII
jgi:hypothetical protein